VIAAFENAVAEAVCRDTRALALPSATTALITAMRALGIGPGSTIGVPSLDWTATAAAARAVGASTSPLPVTRDTGLLDTAYLGRCAASTEGLAAVVAVHLHGLTCDIPALRRANPKLTVLEDAAQAWGARYPNGEQVVSVGHACAFSFGVTKSPSAGELGCLVTRTEQVHKEAVALTQHPTRQLLSGIGNPRRDQPMARVAPVVALLGAHAIHRHAAQSASLRRAGMDIAGRLYDLGISVLTDPALHAPGILAVRADPEITRQALTWIPLGESTVIASVDPADLQVHPDAASDRFLHDLARAITVITINLTRWTGSPARRAIRFPPVAHVRRFAGVCHSPAGIPGRHERGGTSYKTG